MKTKECKQIVKRLMKERLYQRMTFDQLAEFMDLTKKKDRQMLTHVLKELNLKTNDGKDRKKTEKDRTASEKVSNFNNKRTKIADDTSTKRISMAPWTWIRSVFGLSPNRGKSDRKVRSLRSSNGAIKKLSAATKKARALAL